MRAQEFIVEADGNAKITKRQQNATRGLNTFYDGEKWDTDYTLNRVMMAAACTDGKFVPDIDAKSWFGKMKTAQPYTQEEQDMMKMAYKAVNAVWDDLNDGNLNSDELPGTNKTSPVTAFKGYPR
jgi:hypothetical protein